MDFKNNNNIIMMMVNLHQFVKKNEPNKEAFIKICESCNLKFHHFCNN